MACLGKLFINGRVAQGPDTRGGTAQGPNEHIRLAGGPIALDTFSFGVAALRGAGWIVR